MEPTYAASLQYARALIVAGCSTVELDAMARVAARRGLANVATAIRRALDEIALTSVRHGL